MANKRMGLLIFFDYSSPIVRYFFISRKAAKSQKIDNE